MCAGVSGQHSAEVLNKTGSFHRVYSRSFSVVPYQLYITSFETTIKQELHLKRVCIYVLEG